MTDDIKKISFRITDKYQSNGKLSEQDLEHRFPYYGVQRGLNYLARSSDNYGVIHYYLYKDSIVPRFEVIRLLKNLIKNRSGHEIVDFEKRKLMEVTHFYGTWVQLSIKHLKDGSKVYNATPITVTMLINLVNQINHKLDRMEKTNSVDKNLADSNKIDISKIKCPF